MQHLVFKQVQRTNNTNKTKTYITKIRKTHQLPQLLTSKALKIARLLYMYTNVNMHTHMAKRTCVGATERNCDLDRMINEMNKARIYLKKKNSKKS